MQTMFAHIKHVVPKGGTVFLGHGATWQASNLCRKSLQGIPYTFAHTEQRLFTSAQTSIFRNIGRPRRNPNQKGTSLVYKRHCRGEKKTPSAKEKTGEAKLKEKPEGENGVKNKDGGKQ
ncbi:hypothetical protein SARC_10102, partial [Sphaeroforma arctica JP610]